MNRPDMTAGQTPSVCPPPPKKNSYEACPVFIYQTLYDAVQLYHGKCILTTMRKTMHLPKSSKQCSPQQLEKSASCEALHKRSPVEMEYLQLNLGYCLSSYDSASGWPLKQQQTQAHKSTTFLYLYLAVQRNFRDTKEYTTDQLDASCSLVMLCTEEAQERTKYLVLQLIQVTALLKVFLNYIQLILSS